MANSILQRNWRLQSIDDLLSHCNHANGCMEWVGSRSVFGYGVFTRNGKEWLTHRFSWAMSYGEPAGGLHVLHRCDNPPCCNPAHLFLGTPAENMRDKYPRGERITLSKLTEDGVRRIREARLFGAKVKDLANIYGVSSRVIYAAVTGSSWAHVE